MSISTGVREIGAAQPTAEQANWPDYVHTLWRRRRFLVRSMLVSLAVGAAISFAIPKRFTATARIMPPEQQGSSGLMLAALASKAGLGSLGSLAPIFFTGHSTTALFVDLLRSGTVSTRLIDRFDLQRIYGKRYRMDTAKRLGRNTAITDDKRSGVITIAVHDADPVRARDLTQAYLDELNRLIVETNTSSAHRERVFVEQRLHTVEQALNQAQNELSEFSSRNGTIDLKEQTRAVVDAGARLEAQLLIEQSSLNSLRQVYGDGNIRVREAQARIAALRNDLTRMGGVRQAEGAAAVDGPLLELAPALRDVPRLAVPYGDLYRRVKVQETVLELLTQQYETARIEEARDVPVVSVIDRPGVPERKSFPPRTLLTLGAGFVGVIGAAAWVLFGETWRAFESSDPRRVLLEEIAAALPLHTGRGLR